MSALIVYFHNDRSHCHTHFDSDVSLQSSLEREPFLAKQRCELACLSKQRSFTQDVSMVSASSARQPFNMNSLPRKSVALRPGSPSLRCSFFDQRCNFLRPGDVDRVASA